MQDCNFEAHLLLTLRHGYYNFLELEVVTRCFPPSLSCRPHTRKAATASLKAKFLKMQESRESVLGPRDRSRSEGRSEKPQASIIV